MPALDVRVTQERWNEQYSQALESALTTIISSFEPHLHQIYSFCNRDLNTRRAILRERGFDSDAAELYASIADGQGQLSTLCLSNYDHPQRTELTRLFLAKILWGMCTNPGVALEFLLSEERARRSAACSLPDAASLFMTLGALSAFSENSTADLGQVFVQSNRYFAPFSYWQEQGRSAEFVSSADQLRADCLGPKFRINQGNTDVLAASALLVVQQNLKVEPNLQINQAQTRATFFDPVLFFSPYPGAQNDTEAILYRFNLAADILLYLQEHWRPPSFFPEINEDVGNTTPTNPGTTTAEFSGALRVVRKNFMQTLESQPTSSEVRAAAEAGARLIESQRIIAAEREPAARQARRENEREERERNLHDYNTRMAARREEALAKKEAENSLADREKKKQDEARDALKKETTAANRATIDKFLEDKRPITPEALATYGLAVMSRIEGLISYATPKETEELTEIRDIISEFILPKFDARGSLTAAALFDELNGGGGKLITEAQLAKIIDPYVLQLLEIIFNDVNIGVILKKRGCRDTLLNTAKIQVPTKPPVLKSLNALLDLYDSQPYIANLVDLLVKDEFARNFVGAVLVADQLDDQSAINSILKGDRTGRRLVLRALKRNQKGAAIPTDTTKAERQLEDELNLDRSEWVQEARGSSLVLISTVNGVELEFTELELKKNTDRLKELFDKKREQGLKELPTRLMIEDLVAQWGCVTSAKTKTISHPQIPDLSASIDSNGLLSPENLRNLSNLRQACINFNDLKERLANRLDEESLKIVRAADDSLQLVLDSEDDSRPAVLITELDSAQTLILANASCVASPKNTLEASSSKATRRESKIKQLQLQPGEEVIIVDACIIFDLLKVAVDEDLGEKSFAHFLTLLQQLTNIRVIIPYTVLFEVSGWIPRAANYEPSSGEWCWDWPGSRPFSNLIRSAAAIVSMDEAEELQPLARNSLDRSGKLLVTFGPKDEDFLSALRDVRGAGPIDFKVRKEILNFSNKKGFGDDAILDIAGLLGAKVGAVTVATNDRDVQHRRGEGVALLTAEQLVMRIFRELGPNYVAAEMGISPSGAEETCRRKLARARGSSF